MASSFVSFPFSGNEEAIHHIDNLVNWRKHDNTKKRPEVLVPAGTLEKLKVAVKLWGRRCVRWWTSLWFA